MASTAVIPKSQEEKGSNVLFKNKKNEIGVGAFVSGERTHALYKKK
jgi:hypothetical protein